MNNNVKYIITFPGNTANTTQGQTQKPYLQSVTFYTWEMADAGNFGGSVSETSITLPFTHAAADYGSFCTNGSGQGYVTKWPAFYAGCGRINADGNRCRQLHPVPESLHTLFSQCRYPGAETGQ